jgi:transcriptional regulator with XRE-family HTH domain
MNRIKDLRKEKDMTQNDLAMALGIRRSTVASYELARIDPSPKVLKQLTEYFNVSTDYLLGVSNIRTEKRQTVDIHDLMMNILDRLDNDVNVYFNGSVLSDNEKQSFKTIISKNIEMLEQIHLIK